MMYDVLILGAGQAGIPLARKLTSSGKCVAVVERKHLGGSCVNFGCTPTKAAFASARLAYQARRAAEFGVIVAGVSIDFEKVLARARSLVEESKTSIAKSLDECGADVLRGQGRFVSRGDDRFSLSVDDQTVSTRQVVINTGTRTALPKIDGLSTTPFLHAGNWLEQSRLPAHLIIAGAGVIALEMAQFYRRLGSRVTIVGEQIAAQEDRDVADAMQKFLADEGIEFRLRSNVKSVARTGEQLRIEIETNEQRETLLGSDLFIAAGRRPNTDDLGLEAIGVKVDAKGIIDVDDHLATNVPGVWVAGDVRGGPMFTHSSWDDHRILESHLLGDRTRTKKDRIVPYAIFTDPELGRVGMNETEARAARGEHVRVATFEMKHSGKASEIGETKGFIKLIADARDGELLGAAMLCSEGAELVASCITLMNARATLAAICDGIYIHPTLSEAIQSAASALELNIRSTLHE